MSTKSWQMQEAKNKLSEVIHRALVDLPQLITRRGKPVVYVVSAETWEKKTGPSLKKVIRSCPDPDFFDLVVRERSFGRDIDL
jgi:prevent-host-death family protein